ncbi:neocarzinostatin apoprotein domain-containing protein [Actinoplanes sp. NPDC051851]|uniref:neocarzinostatin apoprotein domain-containing protein n=1 Tax=Actinoplanes sp. NPDC051851 TaxID=3154753 RepID=UPI00342C2A46
MFTVARTRFAVAAAVGLIAATSAVFLDTSPAMASPKLHVSKVKNLKDGEKITVYGTGFTKNLTDIALGQCIKNPATSSDCNLTGGAEFVASSSSGKTKTITLTLAKTFTGHKCGTSGCVIAAQLLPSSHSASEVAANKVQVAITFGSSTSTTTSTTTAATTTTTTTDSDSDSDATSTSSSAAADSLAKTGPGMEWASMALVGTALLLPGLGLLAMLPARRRRMASFH